MSQVCTKCCRWWIHKEICCAQCCRRRTKFYWCNIACDVSGKKYLGVDKRCNLATARNATPCVQALSLIEYQITICTWSWTSNEIYIYIYIFFFSQKGIWTVGDSWNSISDHQNLSQIFIEPITFWAVTLPDSALSNVFKFSVCICLHCWNLHVV